MNAPHTMNVERIELLFRQFCIENHISEHIDIRAHQDVVFMSMILQMRRHIAGRSRTISVWVPADWREAVKERWLPKRLLKRWPVLYRDIEAEVFAAYPELKVDPLRGRQGSMVYHTSIRTKDWT